MTFTRVAACLAVLALLSSCGSLGLADIHELKQYEGTYQLVAGKYPACTRRQFVEVSYDQIANHLAVEPLDAQRRHRRWSWLEFGPLNDEPQIANSDFFGLLVYYKYFAKKTDDGWQAQRLRKGCQLKYICGRWHVQELISFNDQTFQLGLLADTQQCNYRRLIFPDEPKSFSAAILPGTGQRVRMRLNQAGSKGKKRPIDTRILALDLDE